MLRSEQTVELPSSRRFPGLREALPSHCLISLPAPISVAAATSTYACAPIPWVGGVRALAEDIPVYDNDALILLARQMHAPRCGRPAGRRACPATR